MFDALIDGADLLEEELEVKEGTTDRPPSS
jgi:hypothetical protein